MNLFWSYPRTIAKKKKITSFAFAEYGIDVAVYNFRIQINLGA